MKESKVLVVNLTGAVTELIRHLVLSGINLEIVNDGKLVEPQHAQEEFLIDALTDCGKYVFLSFRRIKNKIHICILFFTVPVMIASKSLQNPFLLKLRPEPVSEMTLYSGYNF
jgi:hypothetical protein